MSLVRAIARLDIKGPNLVKGVRLEGLRVMGDPNGFAKRYYSEGADELVFIDIVASLYGRNNLHDIISSAAKDIFIPITVGGGVRSVEDVKTLLRAGADKVAINTAAVKRPELISEVAQRFGSQCMVLGIEAMRKPSGGWEAFTDNGREHTGLDVIEWAKRAESLGAGEILLTSVDREGTRKGFDLELIRKVSEAVQIPVIASGGMGKEEDFVAAALEGRADAVAMADILHYGRSTPTKIKELAQARGVATRLSARVS